ncbi:MAG: excinuclease ABC subunit C [Gammaproteobacteria bacterium RIFCSPHIGHO2_12_FULL_41_15]|nr:MAG: excinuclease ABC subunit C [Gammaproteobacteria bacterium RIFCSPHIGHO2_12_FULL_41_15]
MNSNKIKSFPTQPGVYVMYNDAGKILYVGKAKNLYNRLKTYFQKNVSSLKTKALMSHVTDIKTTITETENEALLLEANLIKQYAPKYNVLLRDDKSYPYIYLSTQDVFPRLDVYRGPRKKMGEYYGPFASASIVRETITFLQKMFKLRQCSDSFFRHRSRPCLQYQINRCTAPCVNKINQKDYAKQVEQVRLFLQGKSEVIVADLTDKMQIAAKKQEYERAAFFRDQIVQLRQIQNQQTMSVGEGDVDVLAIIHEQSIAVVCVLQIRSGKLLSKKIFQPDVPKSVSLGEALEQFIPQYYLLLTHYDSLPSKVVLNETVPNKTWLENALMSALKHKIQITQSTRGYQGKWLKLAAINAKYSLQQELLEKDSFSEQFSALQKMLQLPAEVNRIECFDVSHTLGESTVASCVVCTPEGALKSDYRRYNIKDITGGDDYASIKQVLTRRYKKVIENKAVLPDVILIDGGKGQIKVAAEVLAELNITQVLLLSIYKGDQRKAKNDRLLSWQEGQSVSLHFNHEGMRVLQFVRDEAHRFAITAHRAQQVKKRTTSVLETIPGVGPKRRRQLLAHFGGLQRLKSASRDEIARVEGISDALASAIYKEFHGD